MKSLAGVNSDSLMHDVLLWYIWTSLSSPPVSEAEQSLGCLFSVIQGVAW